MLTTKRDIGAKYGIAIRIAIFTVSIIFLYALVLLIFPGSAIVSDTDSVEYMNFSPIRTLGYPVFIKLVGITRLAQFQLCFYIATSAFVSYSFRKLGLNYLYSAMVFLFLVGNPVFNINHSHIMTESPVASLLNIFLASCILVVSGRTPWWLLLAGIASGVAATMKPGAVPLVIIPLLISILLKVRIDRSRVKDLLLAGIIGSALGCGVVATERVAAHLYFGDANTSLMGPHLYAKSAMISVDPQSVITHDPYTSFLAQQAQTRYQSVRDLISRSRGTPAFFAVSYYYEDCLEHRCTSRLRPLLPISNARFDDSLKKAALARLKQNPLGYLRLSFDEFRGLWTIGSRTDPSQARGYDAFINANRPLPFTSDVLPQMSDPTQPKAIMRFVRPGVALLGVIVTILGILGPLTIRRSSNTLYIVAVLSAMTATSVYIFTSLAGIGIARYLLSMWPALAVISASILALLADKLLGVYARVRMTS